MKNKILYLLIIAFISVTNYKAHAQQLKLDSILNEINKVNFQLKMYDADIRSMDEAAKGL